MYVAITVLAQGILPRVDIAAMANPSMAGVLAHMVGPWGKVLISSCLIVSVLSSYLAGRCMRLRFRTWVRETAHFQNRLSR